MKIKGTRVRVSIISLAVVVLLTVFLISFVAATGNYSIVPWGIFSILALFFIPLILNYMSQNQYSSLEPIYEAEAGDRRIKSINASSIGDIVRIEGVVERVLFKSLNRPQYKVADRTGEIAVKMFTSPKEEINKDDYVEVYGQVIKRYMLVGDPVINAVLIRKTSHRKKTA